MSIFSKNVIWHWALMKRNVCYVMMNIKCDSAFVNIKKKNHIDAKSAKILKFYKINKNFSIVNCGTNNGFSMKKKYNCWQANVKQHDWIHFKKN